MTTLERKKYLKQKIDSTESDEILDKIEKILDESQEVYFLSDEQILGVEEARAEYKKGEFLTEEEAEEDIEKWFEEN